MRLSNEEIELMAEVEKGKSSRLLYVVIGLSFLGLAVSFFFNIYHKLPDGTNVISTDGLHFIIFLYGGIFFLHNAAYSSNDKLLVALARRINEMPENETSQPKDSANGVPPPQI